MQFRLHTLLILLAILPPIVAVIAKWFTQKPRSPAPAVFRMLDPQFVVYDLGNADPVITEDSIREKLKKTSRVSLKLNAESGRLSVWGDPSVHKTVRATIRGMQNPPVDSD